MLTRRSGFDSRPAPALVRQNELPIEVLAHIASQTQGADLEAFCLALSPMYGDGIRASLYQFVAAPFRKTLRTFLNCRLDSFADLVTSGLPEQLLQALSLAQRQMLLHIALPVGIDKPLVQQLRGTDHSSFMHRFEVLTQLSASSIDEDAMDDEQSLTADQLHYGLQAFAAFCHCPPRVTEAQVAADPMLYELLHMRDAHLRACARDAEELSMRLGNVRDRVSLQTAHCFARTLITTIDNTRAIMADINRGPRGR